MVSMAGSIKKNLETIQEKLSLAALAAGQETRPEMIAVSKGHSIDVAREALTAGHKIFGENRVQEAASKWPDLKEKNYDIELHLIGPLQTNKVKAAIELFDVIQTLDRPKLARALKKEMAAAGKKVRLFVQVNTGEEPQKAGVSPAELPAFLEECQALGLEIEGLMCIPPLAEEAALHFALLKKLGARHGLKKLSMGMSQDYEKAAALGATHVRVGTAIFGPRS